MRPVMEAQRGSRRAGGFAAALAVATLVLVLRAAPLAAAEAATPASPPAVSAPAIPNAAAGGGLGLPLFSFIDPSRLTWNQSLSFGYSTGGGYGGTSGLYTSSFGYRIADPLHLRVDIGAHLTPSGGRGMQQTQGVFLQGLSLDWQPFKNSVIHFEYQDYRSPLQWSGYSRYGQYGRPAYGFEPFGDPSRN